MAEELKRFSVEVLAWCLMVNHTHLIVVASDARLLARAIGEAHRRYTRMKNFSAGVRNYLFQGSIRFVCIGRASFVGGIVMR